MPIFVEFVAVVACKTVISPVFVDTELTRPPMLLVFCDTCVLKAPTVDNATDATVETLLIVPARSERPGIVSSANVIGNM